MVAQPLRQFCLLGTHIFIHIIINLVDCPGGKPANTPAPLPHAIPKKEHDALLQRHLKLLYNV